MKIVFNGWNIGMKPLYFTKYVMKILGLSLSEAHNISISIRNGEQINIDVSNINLPNDILEKLYELGVNATIEDN